MMAAMRSPWLRRLSLTLLALLPLGLSPVFAGGGGTDIAPKPPKRGPGGDVVAKPKDQRAVWKPAANNPRQLQGHDGYVSWVTFSPDGKWIATSASTQQDRTTRLWNLATRRQAASYDSNHSPVFSPDSKFLATSANVKVDAQTTQVMVVLRAVGQEKALLKVPGGVPSFSPDGRWLAIGDREGMVDVVRMFSLPGATASHVIEGRMHSFSPDGSMLATCAKVDTKWATQVWDAATGEKAEALSGVAHAGGDMPMFALDGQHIAARTDNRRTNPASQLYDLATGQKVNGIVDGEPVAFTSSGYMVTQFPSGNTATQTQLQNISTGQLVEGFPGRFLGISPDGKWLATEGMYDEDFPGVQLYDLATMQRKATVFAGSVAITDVDFSPDSKLMAIASEGATVVILEDLTKI